MHQRAHERRDADVLDAATIASSLSSNGAPANRFLVTNDILAASAPRRQSLSSLVGAIVPRRSNHKVESVGPGDVVVAPFIFSDVTCSNCLKGSTISCPVCGIFGNGHIDGGQGEAVRGPLAGSILVPYPASGIPTR